MTNRYVGHASWEECKWCCCHEHYTPRLIEERPMYCETIEIPSPLSAWKNSTLKEIPCRICGGFGSVIIQCGEIRKLTEYYDIDTLKGIELGAQERGD